MSASALFVSRHWSHSRQTFEALAQILLPLFASGHLKQSSGMYAISSAASLAVTQFYTLALFVQHAVTSATFLMWCSR